MCIRDRNLRDQLRNAEETEKISYHFLERKFEENGDCIFNFNGPNSSDTPSGPRSLKLGEYEELSLLSLFNSKS